MSQPTARVSGLGPESARIDLPREVADREGLALGEELSVFAPGAGLLVMGRPAGREGFVVARLETLSVAELFGFISAGLRSGTAVIQARGERRRIGFQDGQVIFAASTDLSERLGTVLWRKGIVTLAQLERCEPKVGGSVRLGQVLVEAGHLTAGQLYRGFQLQVREIVLGALSDAEGELAFIEGACSEQNTVKLSERTRALTLEGVTRAERMAHLRQLYDLSAPAMRRDAGEPKGIEQRAVYDKVDGKRSLRDVVRASRVGEYAGLTAISQLAGAGLVQAEPAKRRSEAEELPGRATVGPLELYQEAIRRVCEELERAGAATRVRSFYEGLSGDEAALFEGVNRAGRLEPDVERLLTNAQKLRPGAMGRALALEALDGLLAFVLFDARTVLESQRAAELSHAVLRSLRGR